MLVHFDRRVKLAQYFTPYLTSHFILRAIVRRAGQRMHDSKMFKWGLQSIYNNHILNKKFLVKPNWVKIRKSLWGNIAPPPGPEVNLKPNFTVFCLKRKLSKYRYKGFNIIIPALTFLPVFYQYKRYKILLYRYKP